MSLSWYVDRLPLKSTSICLKRVTMPVTSSGVFFNILFSSSWTLIKACPMVNSCSSSRVRNFHTSTWLLRNCTPSFNRDFNWPSSLTTPASTVVVGHASWVPVLLTFTLAREARGERRADIERKAINERGCADP